MSFSISSEEIVKRGKFVYTLNHPPSCLVAYTEWNTPMIGVISKTGEKTLSRRPEYEVIRFHADSPHSFSSIMCDGTPTPATAKDILETAQWAREMAEKWKAQCTHEDDIANERFNYYTEIGDVYENLAKSFNGESDWESSASDWLNI